MTSTTPTSVPNSMIKSINSIKSSVMTSSNVSSQNNSQNPPNGEEYLNKKINFIQNHINNLLIEITNLPEPWTYAVTEDGRVFFINEDEQRTTWLHPKTGQPVSLMIIPPLEDLPNGWQKDYILGLPYLIDHNSKKNYPTSYLNNQSTQNELNVSEKKSNYTERSSRMKNSPNKTSQNEEIVGESVNIESNIINSAISALSSSSTSSSTTTTSSNSSSYQSNGNVIQSNIVQVNTAIDSALRKYGWLYKLSQNGLKLWRKRYFVLTDYILDYYSDSTMTKHCGTIFLNNTHSRPTIKKDGSSAYNKKNSFKVELINTEDGDQSSDMFVYLAAESSSSMSEWINKFNFVSKLKNNSQNRNLYEKNVTSNRSASNSSLRTNNSNYFIVKHDNSNSKRSSKSNSAPSSPGATHRNTFADNSNKKLRSSLSSNKIDDKNNPDKKVIKKKLAFSDDEILNDRPQKTKTKTSKKKESVYSDVETDNECNERLNNSYNQKYLNESFECDSKSKHKRSSSLTKSGSKSSQINLSSSKKTNKYGSTNHIYDYKSIYDAFEKPIVEMTRMAQSLINNNSNSNQDLNDSSARNDNSKNYKVIQNLVTNSNKKNDNDFYQYSKSGSQKSMDYIDRDKIAAAAEAAAAASAALEREKEKNLNNLKQIYSNNSSPKVQNVKPISNFYQITKSQLEMLQKNELEMIIRQLRRNFVLLNHSQQRFSMLQKLYEPYELMYQHRQNQLNGSKSEDGINMNELTSSLHDSYQTIKDRIKKIESKMDSIENNLKVAQSIENNNGYQKIYEDPSNSDQINLNKFSNILRLYEYQIVEMQHENELLLEDKIIAEKLLDNQLALFSKYQNLSNEKSLNQQYSALNQEMDLLKMQLGKVNQLLNDTITDKCKHELVYHQQIQNTLNKSQSAHQQSQQANESASLFRASLINPGSQTSETKSTSSIWKFSSPNVIHKQAINQSNNNNNNNQFNSTDSLLNQSNNSRQNYSATKTKTYHAHHHHYYLNTNTKLNDNNIISKSIDSIYSPASSTGSSNKMNTSTNGFSAFNSINGKKLNIQHQQDSSDEHNKSDSFQPVNFTNSRPRQLNITIQQPNQNTAFQPAKTQHFKREIIAEKKRSSIGKYPQNSYSREFFQPIQNNQQSARERLFGNVNHQQIDSEQVNSRKIALVKPELRGSCENDLISRFSQQNQMEYFDADYSEEIVKNLEKPEIYTIPRGNIEIEPEIDLNDDERLLKEKRIMEIKKMIALQTLQQMNLDDAELVKKQNRNHNDTREYEIEVCYEKEKKAREHLLELRQELAEQIKEKTRQSALNNSTSKAFNSNNSLDILDNADTSKSNELLQTPKSKNYFSEENYYEYYEEAIEEQEQEKEEKKKFEQKTYYSVESIYKNDLINSTPTLPSQIQNFFNSSSFLNAKN